MNREAGVTRVMIVDDHRMFADLLADVLRAQQSMTVTAIAANGAEAVAAARAEPPDVVVLDYRLPGEDGVVVAGRLRALDPDVGLVMLTGLDDDTVLRAAVLAGCTGYVTKDRAIDELVDAVRAVSSGRGAIDTVASARLAAAGSASREATGVTQRELEVLSLLAEGLTTREIAERLFISVNTTRNHVQRLIAKLGAHSRLEAVAIARRAGLFETATIS